MMSRSLWAVVAALAAGLIFVNGAAAATTTVTLTVNSTADSSTPCTIVNNKSAGTCTLRGAILAADASAFSNVNFVIRLAAKTYRLSLGTLAVATSGANIVQIVGKTSGKKANPASFISGAGNAKPASVFSIASPAQMRNVVISGGTGNGDFLCAGLGGCGGGIFLTSGLDLQNSIVRKNRACSAWTGNACTGSWAYGGGIYMPDGFSQELLTLYKTTVTSNTAFGGGGIANDDMTHSMVFALQSHIDKNVACSTFSHGVCVDYGFGGGIANQGGHVTLEYTTVNGNVAGSPAYGSGNGGGIYQNAANMQLDHTTVNGNVAAYQGGGVYDSASVDFVSSTVSGNAAIQGGGVYVSNLASFHHTTVSSNTAGGTFACTIGLKASCAHTISATTGGCATLYPSATACTESRGVGGGVMGDFFSSLEFVSSTVSKNLAASIAGSAPGCHGGWGGGVFSGWTMTALAGTAITKNVADCGGGIYNAYDSGYGSTYPLGLANSTIGGNAALEDGGGIWTGGSASASLYGMKITANHAAGQTGGVWDDELDSLLLGVGNTITTNTGTGACKNVTWPCG